MNLEALIIALIMSICAGIFVFFSLLRPANLRGLEKKKSKNIKSKLSGIIDKFTVSSEGEEYNDLFEKLEDFKYFGFKIANFNDFITIKIISVCFALIFSLITNIKIPKIITLLAYILIAWKLPDIKLSNEIKDTNRKIRSELPYIAEIIALGMEGGMNFNESINFLIQNKKGKIIDLLKEGYFNFSAGGGEEKSYIKAAQKSLSEEFVNLIRTVFQSKRLGIPVSEQIFRLAENLRYKNAAFLKLRVEGIPVYATLVIMGFFFLPIILAIISPYIVEVIKLF